MCESAPGLTDEALVGSERETSRGEAVRREQRALSSG
jgi:hypothetical protein